MLPKTVKNFNVFDEDESWAGKIKMVTPPKITRKRENLRAGGMGGPVKVDLGYEIADMEIELLEYKTSLIRGLGEPDVDGIFLRLLASGESDSAGVNADAHEFVVRGRPAETDFGGLNGETELTNFKVPFNVAYLKYSVNGEVLVELDPVNMIEIIDGVDRAAERRERIGL